jgi:RHS repeat-associated protein
MEKDDEVKGRGNSYDFGARIYDSRIGRWLSIDRKASALPDYNPYHFVRNNPILRIDPDGNTDYVVHAKVIKDQNGTVIKVIATVDIVYQVLDLSSKGNVYNASDIPGESQGKAFSGSFTADNGVKVEVKTNISYVKVDHFDKIDNNKNVLLVVDDIMPHEGEDAKSNPIGRARLDGQVAAVEKGKGTNKSVIYHEFGHNLFGKIFNGKSHSDDPDHLMYEQNNNQLKITSENLKETFNHLGFLSKGGDYSMGSGKAKQETKEAMKWKMKKSSTKQKNAGL